MSYNDECKGCAEFEFFENHGEASAMNPCQFARINKYTNLCPCTFCLIKSMCKDSCDEYKAFETDMETKGMIYEE